MPTLKQHIIFELTRRVKIFLNLEAGVTRGELPDSGTQTIPSSPPAEHDYRSQTEEGGLIREKLTAKDREISRLRAQLAAGGPLVSKAKAENIIWIFGYGRTGSSWLSSIMKDLEGHAQWNEPYVGDLFGMAYYIRAVDRMRDRRDFILGNYYKEVWLSSIRNFILEAASVRFEEAMNNGYLVIKEPNGSVGAPLLLEALPESRMIFLVRDPRDVISSVLSAHRRGGWGNQWREDGSESESLADTDPDKFVRQFADLCMMHLEKAKEAYETHKGPKILVRYEDLRPNTFEVMKRIYAALEIMVNSEDLAQSIEKHDWENVPDEQKGMGKIHRKAKPGGWKEDLTPEQANIVEEITAPILDEFYPGWSGKAGTKSSTSTGQR